MSSATKIRTLTSRGKKKRRFSHITGGGSKFKKSTILPKKAVVCRPGQLWWELKEIPWKNLPHPTPL
jgi:hypothetical protein